VCVHNHNLINMQLMYEVTVNIFNGFFKLKIKKYDIILFCSWVWWSVVFFFSPVVQIGQNNVQNVSENG